jgi:cellulose synthase/poly-beta-1,6-N-acetylglucosamine synthase-like glycosyltransferase
MKIVFWISFFTLFYIYIGYPLLLFIIGILKKKETRPSSDYEPSVSMIIPAHNEENIIEKKIQNTLSLRYPKDKLEVIVVSDASTDRTNDIVSQFQDDRIKFLIQPQREGKAAALNRGLREAKNDIIVFSDASIILEDDALQQIVKSFQDEMIGCVSGEDYISGGGGEGAYGKYELFLRNLESRVESIVGASGCFYAVRRELCEPFPEGMAPDFFSVLKTVEAGLRAVTEPKARGVMESVRQSSQEFGRKIRTLLRGMTTLMAFRQLMNPLRYGIFAVELLSHKILRWCAGVFLIFLFVSNCFLLDSTFFLTIFFLQIIFYFIAILGWFNHKRLSEKLFVKIPLYFCIVNLSALLAWIKYFSGQRQEIWEPSKR